MCIIILIINICSNFSLRCVVLYYFEEEYVCIWNDVFGSIDRYRYIVDGYVRASAKIGIVATIYGDNVFNYPVEVDSYFSDG